MTTTAAQPARLPATIAAIFDKARTVAKNIAAIAADRDRAELSAKVAADNFDAEPSRKSLDGLAAARAELERLAAIVPDDAAAVEAARERIFSDPAAWLALAEALAAKADQFNEAAAVARDEFADAVRDYIRAGGDCPTLILRNEFGGLATEAKRDRLQARLSKRDTLAAQSNLARYISQGQEPGPGVTFESVAAFLTLEP